MDTATVYRDNGKWKIWDNGKENGNYEPKDCILGEWNRKWTLLVYRDNEKENGSYYSILGLYWDNGK